MENNENNTQQQDNNTSKKNRNKKPLSFGKTMIASMLGFMLAMTLGSILLIGCAIGIIIVAIDSDNNSTIVNDCYITLDLTDHTPDRTPDKLQSFLDDKQNTIGLCDMLMAIEHAQSDSKIKGLFLYFGDGGGINWSQSDELRQAVTAFRNSGKPVVAYGNSYTQPSYYLATAANKIFLNPAGIIDLRGIALECVYLKDLLDKYDIHIDLIRPNSNAYKSAGETYTRNNMSDDARQQNRAYAMRLWQIASDSMASARHLTGDSLRHIAANLEGLLANEALHHRLIDTLNFERSARQTLADICGIDKSVSLKKYLSNNDYYSNNLLSANTIAIIHGEGDVLTGNDNMFEQGIYANTITKAIEQAANDNDVKAIVLRLNTPGGAVTASELITDAVRYAKEKKPIIVSMGSMAASAGYEISSASSYIVAQPFTLTGSIGVFAIMPEVGAMLRKHLGITTDTVVTEANAAGMSIMRPMSPTARFMMQRNVEEFYETFCRRIAEGRGLNIETVDSLGRGRVWCGADAVENGLADTLGTLHTAIAIAAQKAGIDNYKIKFYPEAKDITTQLLEYSTGSQEAKTTMLIQQKIPYYRELLYWSKAQPLQARLPMMAYDL